MFQYEFAKYVVDSPTLCSQLRDCFFLNDKVNLLDSSN